MKIRPVRPGKSYVLDIFRAFAQQKNFRLADPQGTEEFVRTVADDLSKATANPITLFGTSAQTMFEYVAASLGGCKLVKSEDAGALHTENDELKVPDFRIVLRTGAQLLVEAKNFFQKSPFQLFRMKSTYLDGLQAYANLFNTDLRIAVYWTRWNTWTLTRPEVFARDQAKCLLGFEAALKGNDMASLGDVQLATTPPLKFRVLTDPNAPRTIDSSGNAQFRFGGIQLFCGESLITDPLEQSIALFMMLYGNWPSEYGEAITEGDQLVAFDLVSEPEETFEGQPFSIAGSMSGMVSRRFLSMTTEGGQVQRLAPKSLESDLGIRIPDDYKGTELPLWRFTMVTSDEPPSPSQRPGDAA